MDVQILDLDSGVASQPRLARLATHVIPLREWGPRLRLANSWGAFRRFEADLSNHFGDDHSPYLRFVGSGDFHHITLALLRRLTQPFNLLVLDNHPDWMRGVPFLHCGTWLYHAAMLPMVRTIYHIGGNVDFDNYFRWLAPWSMLDSGKIKVIPAIRRYQGRRWSRVPHECLRENREEPACRVRVEKLLEQEKKELRAWPLYISFDRDVLQEEYAVVNWDSGHLIPDEVQTVIEMSARMGAGLIGMDVVGDWSVVEVAGVGRRVLHWTEHPTLPIDPVTARTCNESLNLALIQALAGRRWATAV